MTAPDDKPGLGDLLGPDAAPQRESRRHDPPDTVWNPRPYDGAIVRLAEHCGEDPEEVLSQFHGDTALARVLRKALDLTDLSRNERVFLMRAELAAEGMTRDQQDRVISDYITSERDPFGNRLRGLKRSSVKETAKRGAREFRNALADMFDPTRRK